MDIVEQELGIPETDNDKIDWLWNRIDELHQANLNFASENKILERRLEAREMDNAKLRESQGILGKEIANMNIELNKARQAAATAVEEYRANVET